MRHLKTIGLAAIAAMALMAFAGAGPAEATVLCTSTDTPACAHVYPAGTSIQFSQKTGTDVRITSGGSTAVTCTGISVKGQTQNTGTSTQAVQLAVQELIWSSCSQTTHTLVLGTLSIRWIEGTHVATVLGTGTQWTTIIGGASCTYGFGESAHLGNLSPGEEPVLKIEAAAKKLAGAASCPAETGLDTELVVTSPHAVFPVGETGSVFEEGTLCKSTVTPCANAYGKGTTIDADLNGSIVFEGGGNPVGTCSGGTLKAKTDNAGSNTEAVTAGIEALTWSGCSQTTTTITKGSLEIRRIQGTENGTVIGKKTEFTLAIAGTSCTYGFGEESDLGTLTGKESPAIDIDTEIPKTAGGFVCPASLRLTAEYKLTAPAPLYVEGTEKGVLCKSTTTPCASPYAREATVDIDVTESFSLVGSGGTTLATCTGGTIRGNVPRLGEGKTVVVPLEEWTWSGCAQTTKTVALGKLEIERIEGTENGTVTGRGTQVTFGMFGTTCTYGFGEGTHLGTLLGGAQPTLSSNMTVSRIAGGFLCPSTATWKASYKLTQPAPLYLEPV